MSVEKEIEWNAWKGTEKTLNRFSRCVEAQEKKRWVPVEKKKIGIHVDSIRYGRREQAGYTLLSLCHCWCRRNVIPVDINFHTLKKCSLRPPFELCLALINYRYFFSLCCLLHFEPDIMYHLPVTCASTTQFIIWGILFSCCVFHQIDFASHSTIILLAIRSMSLDIRNGIVAHNPIQKST